MTAFVPPLPTGVRLSSNTDPEAPTARFPAGFAVVDVETTGLRWKADRVIEIAVVRLDVAGQVISEFVTLIDPERNPGATHIHGLTAEDLQGAPKFSETLQDLLRHLDGAVLVGHNVTFDASFLREEFLRAGILMPRVPLLCTREMAQTVFPGMGDFRLAACCRAYDIPQGQEHRAVEDARATAQLFVRLWNEDVIQRDAPRDVQHARTIAWPSVAEPSRALTREESAKMRKAETSRLAEWMNGLPEGSTTNSIDSYLDLLDEVLEDRFISDEDAAALANMVATQGFLRDDVLRAHRTYLANLARAVLDAELGQGVGAADILAVMKLLGLSEHDMTEAMDKTRREPSRASRLLKKPLRAGVSVCFTGNPIPTKPELEGRAIAAGLFVKESVTKKLELLVVDEPRSMSNKAQKARTLGTRIMAVPVFLLHLKLLSAH